MGKFLGFGVASDVGGDSSKIPHYYISHLIVFKTSISFTGTDHMLLGVFSVPVTPFPTSSEFIEAAVPLTGRFTYQVRSPSQPPSKPSAHHITIIRILQYYFSRHSRILPKPSG